jgi:murein DD-endopeptidase MepM/ murein hydrolase activator NlpD
LNSVAVAGGQSVGRGQRIGVSGNSGNSTGPHLHFAIRIHPYARTDGWGGYSDPLPYMAPGDVILPGYVQAQMAQDLWPMPVRTLMTMQPLPPPGMAEETPGMVRP